MLIKKFCGKEICINREYEILSHQLMFYIGEDYNLNWVNTTIRLYRRYLSLNHKLIYRLELNFSDKNLTNDIIYQIRNQIICSILEKVGGIEGRLEVVLC